MELDGISAHVAIEGEKTEAYNVEVSSDKKTATCWIASEAGKVRPWLHIHGSGFLSHHPEILSSLERLCSFA
jgi:hypothetical protein